MHRQRTRLIFRYIGVYALGWMAAFGLVSDRRYRKAADEWIMKFINFTATYAPDHLADGWHFRRHRMYQAIGILAALLVGSLSLLT